MTHSGFVQRRGSRLIIGIGAMFLMAFVVTMALGANPTVQYTFEPNGSPADDLTSTGGIHNRGSGKSHDGTEIDKGMFSQFVPGPSGKMNAIHLGGEDGPNSSTGTGIVTNTTTGDPDLNIQNGPFTVMAWVNRDGISGDNMVFGTGFGDPKDNPNAGGDGSLHLGFRDSAVYMGFWNHDNNAPGILPGEWHHVAWRFDSGTQDILVDGELVSTDPNGQAYGNDFALLIGRQVFNQGAYAGSLSDVRIYNVALADADVLAIASSPP
jgi:hypothetical protein